MIKKLTAVLILAAVIFCGIAAAEDTLSASSLTIVVTDTENNYISNADVTLISADKTQTNTLRTLTNGVAEFPSLRQGEYTLTVTKIPEYITVVKTVTVGSSDGREMVQMTKEPPVLITVVETDRTPIQGAEIKINNIVAGKTDEFGCLSAYLTRGANNIISVTAASHIPYTETKYISADITALPEITLSLSETTPLILIYNEAKSPISGAKVSIDGKLVSYSDTYGRAQLPTYTTGITYDIEISCDGYADYKDKIEFTPEKTDFVVTLAYAAAPVKVTVKTDSKVLSGALVYFDGTNKGQTGEDGTFTTTASPGTSILITASADGYNGEGVTCSVEAAKVNEVTILMKENIPTTLIGIGALAVIVILLIVIIGITGYKRSKKVTSKKSYAPGQRRDSL
ncbi:MAG TPA: carboxypeptidase regulatory-like domain-containing protein [Methanocorpusculum sp.]|nr:carboxypeptidase regulatory-like domain-containing protein [Methanocorpusculum sp.]